MATKPSLMGTSVVLDILALSWDCKNTWWMSCTWYVASSLISASGVRLYRAWVDASGLFTGSYQSHYHNLYRTCILELTATYLWISHYSCISNKTISVPYCCRWLKYKKIKIKNTNPMLINWHTVQTICFNRTESHASIGLQPLSLTSEKQGQKEPWCETYIMRHGYFPNNNLIAGSHTLDTPLDFSSPGSSNMLGA